MPKQHDYSVPAIERAIAILNALAEKKSMSISDVHNELNIPKTTAFVILNTLESNHLIERNEDGKIQLGHRTFYWGMSYYRRIDIIKIAKPYMKKLVEGTPYTAHLAILVDSQPVYIDKVEGNGFVRFATSIGQHLPLHLSGVGKALAVHFSEDEIISLIEKDLDGTSVQRKRQLESILEDIQFVKEHGYSIEDEQMEEGIRCLGAPIYGPSGDILASISITALSKDLPAVKFQTWGQKVKNIALQISKELGYYHEPASETSEP